MKNSLSNLISNVFQKVDRFSSEPNAEGLFWIDYHPLPLATSVLPAALIYAGIESIKKTITAVDTTDDLNSRIPSNALVYLLHADIWVSALCTDEIAKVVSWNSGYQL
jgi:hypothetical protein